MRDENARLGVETTMRSDRIARSATESQSNWLIDQRHSARPDRKALEKAQQGGPRIGSSSALISVGAWISSRMPWLTAAASASLLWSTTSLENAWRSSPIRHCRA